MYPCPAICLANLCTGPVTTLSFSTTLISRKGDQGTLVDFTENYDTREFSMHNQLRSIGRDVCVLYAFGYPGMVGWKICTPMGDALACVTGMSRGMIYAWCHFHRPLLGHL